MSGQTSLKLLLTNNFPPPSLWVLVWGCLFVV